MMGLALSGSTKRYFNFVFDRMKMAKGNPLVNLWNFMGRNRVNTLRRAWFRWSNDMYIERALDWEQNYFKAAILHPFFTNYAKINERIEFHQKCQAFSQWAYNPQRRFLSGMLRFKNHTYGNLHDFLSSWKLKAKMRHVQSQKYVSF